MNLGMVNMERLRNGFYKRVRATKVELSCQLESFPLEILELGESLEVLDLSHTGLSSLPPGFGSCMSKLQAVSFSGCRFTTFPTELVSCPRLHTIDFAGNDMVKVPEDALPRSLRYLILEDNKLQTLPDSIGECPELVKCILTANQLHSLPSAMFRCKKLSMLRIGMNKLRGLPDWLLQLPELAYLSFGSNLCSSPAGHMELIQREPPTEIAMECLSIQSRIVYDKSGSTCESLLYRREGRPSRVAVKVFNREHSGDNTPADEMAALLAAPWQLQANLPRAYGLAKPKESHGWPRSGDVHGGIVMELLTPQCKPLGRRRSDVQRVPWCTRDIAELERQLTLTEALHLLCRLSDALCHMHDGRILHGDFALHNVLYRYEDDEMRVTDFGAATIYSHHRMVGSWAGVERLEVLAFGHLMEDLLPMIQCWELRESTLGLAGHMYKSEEEQDIWWDDMSVLRELGHLQRVCCATKVDERPCFPEVHSMLGEMVKDRKRTKEYWRGRKELVWRR